MKFASKNATLILALVLSVPVAGCADSLDAQEKTQLEKAPLSNQETGKSSLTLRLTRTI